MSPVRDNQSINMYFNIHKGEKLIGSERAVIVTVAHGDLSLTG